MIELSVMLNLVQPNPWQPREGEDPEHVRNLALSIHRDGLLQKPLGRLVDANGAELAPGMALDFDAGHRVQLAFGHSRLAAFTWLHHSPDAEDLRELPGEWSRLPVLVRSICDEEMFRLAISENLQRRDLSTIEEAKAMMRYRDEFGKTSAEIGGLFGLSDSAVRNKMRLLKLPRVIQDMLRARTISEGAARALIALYEISEEKRAAAENEFGLVKPSEIIDLAIAGTAPGQIAQMVEQLAERIDPQPVQMAFDASTYRPAAELVYPVEENEAEDASEAVKAMREAAAQWQRDADSLAEREEIDDVSVETEEETRAFPEEIPAAPVAQRQGAAVPAPAVKPVQAARSISAPVAAPEVPAPEPEKRLPWDESTITLTLTFWPDDGHEDGRLVAIGGRVNHGAPRMRMARQGDFEMGQLLNELFVQLSNEYTEAQK